MAAKKRSSRNDKSTDITPVGGAGNGDAPENWLADLEPEQDDSLAALKSKFVVPIIKVVQSNTRREVKDQFGEGSIIINGVATLVPHDPRNPGHLLLVPVFHFVEWMTWSDRKDKQSPMILDRSFDPSSEIAKKAADHEKRFEEYGDEAQFKKRHVEHLNFISIIHGDHELRGTPVVVSFSRGEYKKGRAFINAIMLRRAHGRNVPLWAQVWQFQIGTRENEKGEWYGLDFQNPTEVAPFIRKDQVGFYQGQYLHLKELYEERLLVADHPDLEEEDPEDGDSEF